MNKHSPVRVLALYAQTMYHENVGVCLMLVHGSVFEQVPPEALHMGNVEPSRT